MENNHNAKSEDTARAFRAKTRTAGRRACIVSRRSVEWMVKTTQSYPRAVVYGLIGFVIGSLGGPLAGLLLGAGGACQALKPKKPEIE